MKSAMASVSSMMVLHFCRFVDELSVAVTVDGPADRLA